MANEQPTPTEDVTPGLKFKLPEKALTLFSEVESQRQLPPGTLLGLYVAENDGQPDFVSTMRAESPKQARGPFQIRDDALVDTGRDPKTFWQTDGKSLRANAEAAADYALKLLDYTREVPGDPSIRIASAYNMGAGQLKSLLSDGKVEMTPESLDKFTDRGYVSRFLKATPSGGIGAEPQATAPTMMAQRERTPEDKLALLRREEMLAKPGGAVTAANTITAVPEAIGTLASQTYQNVVAPTLQSFLQFPGELTRHKATNEANELMREQWPVAGGPPPELAMPPTTIDPVGAANFAGTLFSPATAVGNMAVTGGLGVLNAADAEVQNDLVRQGIDPTSVTLAEKLERLSSKFNYQDISKNLPTILGGTAFAGLLAPNRAYHARVAKAKNTVAERYAEARRAIDEHNAPIAEFAKERTEAEKWIWAERQNALREKVDLHNQARQEAMEADRLAEEAYAQSMLETQDRIARAEGLTGIKHLGKDKAAWELNMQKQNQAARDHMLNLLDLPPDDPSGPLFQQWLGDWETPTAAAQREIPYEVVEEINAEVQRFKDEAARSVRADGPISSIPALGQPEIRQQLEALEAQIAELSQASPGHDDLPKLWARHERLYDQLRPVTVKDIHDYVTVIDQMRRTQTFKANATARDMSLMNRLSQHLRGEDSPILDALTPEDAAIWRQANAVSLEWNEKSRAVDMVLGAFKDIEPGAARIRNNLVKQQDQFVRMFGQQRYNEMLEVSRALDDLYLKFPDPPKKTVKGVERKFVPRPMPFPIDPRTQPGWRNYPDPPSKDEWMKVMAADRAGTFIQSVNQLFAHTERRVAGSMAAGALATAAGGTAYRHGVDPIQSVALSAGALAAILTVPAIGRAFAAGARRVDYPESREFLESMAKLVTLAQLHGAYSGNKPVPASKETLAPPPTTPPGPSLPERLPPPNMPTQRTGGPIPAPSPTPARVSSRGPRISPLG